MDGISLDGIMGMVRSMLPTLSYFVNMLTKAFDIFTSYLGFEIVVPDASEEEDAGEVPNA